MPRTRPRWWRRLCAPCPPSANASADRRSRTRCSPAATPFPKPRARSWSFWLENTCNELLGYCLRGEDWPPELLDRAIAEDEGRALLSIVVERLADLFEPRLC